MKLSVFLIIFIFVIFLIAIAMFGALIAICVWGRFIEMEENHENITKRN